jgi:hypothetical protein
MWSSTTLPNFSMNSELYINIFYNMQYKDAKYRPCVFY